MKRFLIALLGIRLSLTLAIFHGVAESVMLFKQLFTKK